MPEKIREILNIAVQAPSGDNSQPWTFVWHDPDILEVYNKNAADDSMYNFKQRGSFISHGALLENISIAAAHFGYTADIQLFPHGETGTCTARIRCRPDAPKPEMLFTEIPKRATNRKPYTGQPLQPSHISALLAEAETFKDLRFQIVEDKKAIERIAGLLCYNETLMLSNFHIHRDIFSVIRWDKTSEQATKSGLFVGTLELDAMQKKAFSLFRHWPVMNVLRHLGLPKLVSEDTKKRYASSSAFGLISIPNQRAEQYVRAGMMLQRIWLRATSVGVAMQPTAAMVYLYQRITESETNTLSKNEISRIKSFIQELSGDFNVQPQAIAMFFRLGYASPPSDHSLKREAEITDHA